MKITPISNNIYFEPTKEEKALGEYSLCEYGAVLAIGPEVKEVKVGDIISMVKHGINEVEINGKKYYTVREDPSFVTFILEK
jgi:co-chaperonin GroES (HSP10)